MRLEINVWLSAKEAAKKLSVSTDTINRLGLPWVEGQEYVQYRIRYMVMPMRDGDEGDKRYYEPDCEKMLQRPKPRSRGIELVPRFTA